MTEFDRAMECMQDNTESIFSEINKECESYWEDNDKADPYVQEYMFHDPVDMISLMKLYIENEKLQRQITADSFKKRSGLLKEQLGADKQMAADVALPEYVYVF